jgi:NAD(P)-dependent dehydrogenase (short-subunit alcohol dehydrogenase family)
VAECAERYGVPDGFANCAGEVLIAPLHRTSEAQYRQCLRANLDTAFFGLTAWIDALRAAGRPGAAVLVSSVAGRIGIPNHEAVAAAKGAIEALVRSAAATYAPLGLRINAVAPGLVDTPATAGFLRTDVGRRAMAAQYPLGRYGVPADVASAMAWLLSDEAAWTTGQILGVDGGFTAVRPTVKGS